MFGTKAAYRGGDAVRKRASHAGRPHLVGSLEPPLDAIRDTAESVCGITDYAIGRAFYTTGHYGQGAIGRALADGGLRQDLIHLAQTQSKAARHRD